MPLDLALYSLPNIITPYDRERIEYELYHTGSCHSLYKEDGSYACRTYDLGSEELVNKLKEKNLIIIGGSDATIAQAESVTFIFSGESIPQVVSNDDYSFIPRGELFDKYKSELKVIPILVNGKYNFDSSLVSEHLDIAMGLTKDNADDELYDISNFKNRYVIIHPETLTYAYFDINTSDHPFEVVCTNQTFVCDSLDLAIKLSFEWAISECDYHI